MDPTIATMLLFAFIVALVFSVHETKAALEAPFCAECPHCQSVARAKAAEQQELRDWYARRWQIPDRDDEDRR